MTDNKIRDFWQPITNAADIAHLGKLIEELNELSNVAARCIIQGLDGIDPKSQNTNIHNLENEIADVLTLIEKNFAYFCLDRMRIQLRVEDKLQYTGAWLQYLVDLDHGVNIQEIIYKFLSTFADGCTASYLIQQMISLGYDKKDIAREVRIGLDNGNIVLGDDLQLMIKES